MTFHHLLTLLSSLLLAGIVLGLIGLGWRHRRDRQSGIARPAPVPERLDGAQASFACPAQYVSTTRAGTGWIGSRSTGWARAPTGQALVLTEGLIIVRDGAEDLWVPAEAIRVLRRESGMAGKFVEKDGLAVITWDLGGLLVDTGLRTRRAADTPALLQALRAIAPHAADRLPEPAPPAPAAPADQTTAATSRK
ncbi:ABC transporter permease [Rothia kristinae]|uniref:PH-like domain-containing protein n=1 Tax=Rothia kristinae TaxID=37923 RepID=UPI0018C94DFC|nr:ABC transporter permease [Rothia kristinae]